MKDYQFFLIVGLLFLIVGKQQDPESNWASILFGVGTINAVLGLICNFADMKEGKP